MGDKRANSATQKSGLPTYFNVGCPIASEALTIGPDLRGSQTPSPSVVRLSGAKLVATVNPYTLNPPDSAVEFEKLCLALLKRHWSRPGLERFAKKGEGQ